MRRVMHFVCCIGRYVTVVYNAYCVYTVYSPVEMTDFSAMVHPISKAVLNATPSARIVELAKPLKRRASVRCVSIRPKSR